MSDPITVDVLPDDETIPETSNRTLRLAELLCARLCHELSSPMGTLAGVMELMAESGNTAVEARTIAEDAAAAVRSRLRLLRAAWTADCGPMEGAEIRAMAEGLRLTRRVSVDADRLRGDFKPQTARLLLNVMLLGVEALCGQGVLRLEATPSGDAYATIEGPRAAWPVEFVEAIRTAPRAWALVRDSRTLQAPFTAILAHEQGVMLEWEPREDQPAVLRIRVREKIPFGQAKGWPK